MLEALKQQVYQANMELPRRGLVTYTWGNVSGIDRAQGLVVIKPSGVEYDALTPDDLVVLDLDGRIVEGKLNPSSDNRTHLELYRAFPALGGIVHTHSAHAVGWAQAQRDIPCFGTTHADYFYGAVPCTRQLTEAEIDEDYERNTGKVIIETFAQRNLDPVAVPGVICASHGPFTWGKAPHRRYITPWCWRRLPAWRSTPCRSILPPRPRRSIFRISITCASTAPTPIMGRNKKWGTNL